jgi:hypothetical protein
MEMPTNTTMQLIKTDILSPMVPLLIQTKFRNSFSEACPGSQAIFLLLCDARNCRRSLLLVIPAEASSMSVPRNPTGPRLAEGS